MIFPRAAHSGEEAARLPAVDGRRVADPIGIADPDAPRGFGERFGASVVSDVPNAPSVGFGTLTVVTVWVTAAAPIGDRGAGALDAAVVARTRPASGPVSGDAEQAERLNDRTTATFQHGGCANECPRVRVRPWSDTRRPYNRRHLVDNLVDNT